MPDPTRKSELIRNLAKAQVFDADKHSIPLLHTCPGCGNGPVSARGIMHRRTNRHMCDVCGEIYQDILHPVAAETLEICRQAGDSQHVTHPDGIYAMGLEGETPDGDYTVAVKISDGVIIDVLPVSVLDVEESPNESE